MADIFDLFGEDPGVAQMQARALADAMRRRKAAGTVATVVGGPFAQAGRAFLGEAGDTAGMLGQAGQFQGTQKRLVSQAAAAAAQRQAELAATESNRREQIGIDRENLKLNRDKLDQDAFVHAVNPATGETIIYNRKTGQQVQTPLSGVLPNGGRPAGTPPLKPAQLWDDVAKLGKDLEFIGQMREDVASLGTVAEQPDVPGFGPVAGRVPDLMASNDALAARQAAKRLMASIIQMRSGTAASDREVERLLAANGLGPTATNEAFRLGVENLKGQALETIGRMEAKYHPDVVRLYRDRGGVTREDFNPKKPDAPAAAGAATAPPKRRKFNPATGALE